MHIDWHQFSPNLYDLMNQQHPWQQKVSHKSNMSVYEGPDSSDTGNKISKPQQPRELTNIKNITSDFLLRRQHSTYHIYLWIFIAFKVSISSCNVRLNIWHCVLKKVFQKSAIWINLVSYSVQWTQISSVLLFIHWPFICFTYLFWPDLPTKAQLSLDHEKYQYILSLKA